MFNNIGRKCKNLAVVVCGLGISISLVYAFMLFNSKTPGSTAEGIGVLIGGILGSWLGSWALFAIGEAAENSATIVEQNKTIIKLLSDNGHTIREESPVERFINHHPVVKNNPDNRWKCSKCGSINDDSESFCKDCGTYKE